MNAATALARETEPAIGVVDVQEVRKVYRRDSQEITVLDGIDTGTGQTDSFSEIAFAFRISPEIASAGMAFAVVMGLVGGLLPALRGARLPVVAALRDV